MGNYFGNGHISHISAEFKNKTLEKQFEKNEIGKIKKFSSKSVLIYGVIYFLFVITDNILKVNEIEFRLLLVNRAIILIISFVLYRTIKTLKSYKIYLILINSYLFLGTTFFNLAFCIYIEKTFLIQTMGAILVIMAVFSLPNKFIYSTILTTFFAASYLIIARFEITPFNKYNYIAAVVYIIIFLFIGMIMAYKANRLGRMNFYTNLELIKSATTDPLTGIYNRLKFDEEIRKHIKLAKETKRDLAVILFDVDNFKFINDTYGHLTGDRILIAITKVVKKHIKTDYIFARWGGDEFAILLLNCSKLEAVDVANKINHSLSKMLRIINKKLSCSFEVASFSDEDDINTLIKKADDMLYKAKQQGKNTVCY